MKTYFQVKNTIRIKDKIYRPCICYEITNDLRQAVLLLNREGKATIHLNPVYFQNGKIINQKAKEVKLPKKVKTIAPDPQNIALEKD